MRKIMFKMKWPLGKNDLSENWKYHGEYNNELNDISRWQKKKKRKKKATWLENATAGTQTLAQ